MGLFLVPNLLLLLSDEFQKFEILQRYSYTRGSNHLVENNFEISIFGNSEVDRDGLMAGSPHVTISVQNNLVNELVAIEKFQPNLLQVAVVTDIQAFNDSLLQIIRNARYSWKWYSILWPEICTSYIEAESIFKRYADTFFTNLPLTANVYVMFLIRTDKLAMTNDTSHIVIWEAYTVAGKVISNQIDMEKTNTLHWYVLNNKLIRRKNLRQGTIRAISVNDSAWENETKYRPRIGNDTSEIQFESGYAVYTLWVMRDYFNFSVKAMKGNWSGLDDGVNGSSVLIGNGYLVAKGEADISISQQVLNLAYKQNGLHLLHPTNSAGLRLYFIQPEMSQYRDIFVTPFVKDLWIVVFGVFALILFTVKCFGWILVHIANDEDEKNIELADSVMVWGIAIMAQQGYHVEPSSLSIRIVFLFGYVTGLVCFIAYSAQIVSTLSVKSVPIHRTEDVLNGQFQLYANPNNTPKAVMKHILKGQKRGTDSVFMEEQESLRRILQKQSVMQALVAEPDIFYTEARALNCSNREICDLFSSMHLNRVPIKGGMFVPKASPYIEWFNYAIILMLERGLNHRYLSNYMKRSWVICLQEKNAFVQPVKIIHIQSAYKILLSGYFASFATLICELVVKFMSKKVKWNGRFLN